MSDSDDDDSEDDSFLVAFPVEAVMAFFFPDAEEALVPGSALVGFLFAADAATAGFSVESSDELELESAAFLPSSDFVLPDSTDFVDGVGAFAVAELDFAAGFAVELVSDESSEELELESVAFLPSSDFVLPDSTDFVDGVGAFDVAELDFVAGFAVELVSKESSEELELESEVFLADTGMLLPASTDFAAGFGGFAVGLVFAAESASDEDESEELEELLAGADCFEAFVVTVFLVAAIKFAAAGFASVAVSDEESDELEDAVRSTALVFGFGATPVLAPSANRGPAVGTSPSSSEESKLDSESLLSVLVLLAATATFFDSEPFFEGFFLSSCLPVFDLVSGGPEFLATLTAAAELAGISSSSESDELLPLVSGFGASPDFPDNFDGTASWDF